MQLSLPRTLQPRYIWAHWITPRLWWAIVVGTPVGAMLMGLLVASHRIPPEFLLVLPVATIAVLLWQQSRSQNQIALLAVVLSAGLVNFFTLPTGTESRITVSFIIAGAMVGGWVLQMVFLRRGGLAASPINRPLLAFIGISTVAFGWSILFRDPLVWAPRSFPIVQAAALAVNVILVLLTLYVANTVRDARWLRWLTWIMIGLGATSITLFFLQSPLQSLVLNNGARGLFGAWVALFAYGLALFNEKLRGWQRLLLLVLVLLLVYRYFFVARSWVSGWLPLGFGCAVLTLAYSRRLFVLLLGIGLVYLALNFTYYYDDIVLSEEAEGSGTERVALWVNNLNHVKNHLLFGMGPAGYAVYNMSYHPEDARSTHNNYFDVLAQTGVTGLAALIWLFGTFIAIGNWTRRKLRKRRDFLEAFANATFAGCFAVLVSMMLGDWILPFAYNQTITGFDNACYSWIFLGGMVSLANMVAAGEIPPVEDVRSFP